MSKIIRSMQDDLKEAEERKKKEARSNGEKHQNTEGLHEKMRGFSLSHLLGQDNDEDEREEKKTPQEEKEENKIERKTEEPAPSRTAEIGKTAEKEKTEQVTEQNGPINKAPSGDLPEQKTAKQKDEPEKVQKTEQQAGIVPEEKVINKQEEELKNLISRISGSLNETKKPAQATSETPLKTADIADKDSELKELLERMSASLKKDEKGLKQESEKVTEKIPEEKIEKTQKQGEEEIIEDELEQSAGKDGSYWSDLHKTMKEKEKDSAIVTTEIIKEAAEDTKTEPIIPKMEGPRTPEKTKPTEVETKKIEKQIEQSGVIIPRAAEKKEAITAIKKSLSDKYVNPENRLIFGKQEYYSSVHKKVQTRIKKDDLKEMEKALKTTEKKLSPEEEKKMLRRQIIKKYQIKLYSLPWIKIVIFTVLFLGTLGGTLYHILPQIRPQSQQTEKIAYGSNIALLTEKMTTEVVVKGSAIAGINYFNAGIDPWATFANKETIRLVIEHDDAEAILSKKDALISLLGETNAGNIPQEIIDNTTESYGVIVFKNGTSMRLGLVLAYEPEKDGLIRGAMNAWGNTAITDQRIYVVMKRLFLNDRITETYITNFQTGYYNGTELNYVNLPDSATSMDYVIINNMIIFTTSKETTRQMIELLG
ncbi:MAG: hypothetical protein PHI66_00810 [Candidatus Pacebacteria bacterium]|nr:hypothetical protein [Candidatus Paceibacterota bacterium]